MFLHAFQEYQPRGDYYIMTEVDYVPWHAHFDQVLVGLYRDAFRRGREPGVLCGVLCGLPVDAKSPLSLYPESSQIMDTASLQHVLRYVWNTLGWQRSTAEQLMTQLVYTNGSRGTWYGRSRYNYIQEGFGLLMKASGTAMRDYTSHYRAPYYTHIDNRIVDWGAHHNFSMPMQRVIFVPAQWLYSSQVHRCCVPKSRTICFPDCVVDNWRNGTDCCARSRKITGYENMSTTERRRVGAYPVIARLRARDFSLLSSSWSADADADDENMLARVQPPRRFRSADGPAMRQ